MAEEVKATVFGSLAAKSIQKALKRICLKVRKQDFNCLEVTKMVENRFLGVPYITVCTHPRHIQQGCWLDSFCRETRNPLTEADSAARSRIGMISLRPVFAGKRALGHVFSGLKPFATPAAGGAGAATEPCPRRPIDPSKFLIADNSALAVAARGDPPASRIASCFSPCG